MTQELLAKKCPKTSCYVKWKTTQVTNDCIKNCKREILKQIQVTKSDYFSWIYLQPIKHIMKKTWHYHNSQTLLNTNKIANTFKLVLC